MSTWIRLTAPSATGDSENLGNRVGTIVNLNTMELSLTEEHEMLFPILDEEDKCDHIYL